ncbi:hypothetical protein BH23CHL6_BH23CHL6_00910 [soil metagenome]
MDELIQQIQQRTGIDEAQARGAADTVLGFLKERLPAPIAGQIDGIVGGGGAAGAAGNNPLGGLGDLGKVGG